MASSLGVGQHPRRTSVREAYTTTHRCAGACAIFGRVTPGSTSRAARMAAGIDIGLRSALSWPAETIPQSSFASSGSPLLRRRTSPRLAQTESRFLLDFDEPDGVPGRFELLPLCVAGGCQ